LVSLVGILVMRVRFVWVKEAVEALCVEVAVALKVVELEIGTSRLSAVERIERTDELSLFKVGVMAVSPAKWQRFELGEA